MKIDVFSQILPKKNLETCCKKNKQILASREESPNPVTDLDERRRRMDVYPDVLQVERL